MRPRSVWLAGLLVCVPVLVNAQNSRISELPAGEGRELVQEVCSSCHSLTPVLMKRDGEGGWRHTVGRMVLQRQAQLLPEEFEAVVRYLSTRLGPGMSPMQTGVLPPEAFGGGATAAREVALPEGAGKPLVAARCALCHDLGRVVSVPRTTDEWAQITRNMIDRGPDATAEEVQTIAAYLSAHFGEETP